MPTPITLRTSEAMESYKVRHLPADTPTAHCPVGDVSKVQVHLVRELFCSDDFHHWPLEIKVLDDTPRPAELPSCLAYGVRVKYLDFPTLGWVMRVGKTHSDCLWDTEDVAWRSNTSKLTILPHPNNHEPLRQQLLAAGCKEQTDAT